MNAPSLSQDAKIQQLLGRLHKESTNFSPEIQDMLQDLTVQSSQQATKELHSQVTRLGQAKKQLQLAIDARGRLYRSWQSYIADAIQRWEKNVKDFQEEESKVESDLQRAKDNLIQAKESLEAAKLQATRFNLAVTAEEDGEDDAEMLATAMTGKRIHQNTSTLVSTLQALHSEAIADAEDCIDSMERAPKLAKVTPSEVKPQPAVASEGPNANDTMGGDGEPSGGGPKALQPFGAPVK